mgnify:CR=1 FL=1
MEDRFMQLIQRQKEHFYTGATLPVQSRLQALKALQAALERYEEPLCRALFQDLHKSAFEAYETEIGVVRAELRYFLRSLPGLNRPCRVATPLTHFPSSTRLYRDPYGATLLLAPWNYPVQLCLLPLIGAIAGGNCAVVKTSAHAPAVSAVLKQMLQEIYPPEYVAVVEGREPESRSLAEGPFDLIFFTGSPAVGREIMEKAARNLTPVVLELGGKSPCIVDETADLDLTARRIVWGKSINAGQTCVAPDYVLVQERVKPALLEKLKEWAVRLQGTDPLHSPDLAHIVNFRHFRRLQVLRDGSPVYCGGGELEESLAMELTVLTPRSWEEPVMQQEIFGPLLPVLGYETLEEVIALLQKKPEPLALYLFTNDRETQRRVMEHLRFGGGCVNDTIMHVATNRIGFGGVGESGMGSYHGRSSFEAFTHAKGVVKKPAWLDLSLRYPPYEGKLPLLKKLLR